MAIWVLTNGRLRLYELLKCVRNAKGIVSNLYGDVQLSVQWTVLHVTLLAEQGNTPLVLPLINTLENSKKG